jgi:hypothetical protein
MRIVYFYSMKHEPDTIGAVAPAHAAYWRERELPEYEGGPFADRSGGLITFVVESAEEAERVIAGDPFMTGGLLEDSIVKEWTPE